MSVENWSKNTYNLNTKRAIVQKNGIIEWINGNLGSGVTMLYPCSILAGENAKSDSLGIAFAAEGQNQDTGSKVIHAAPNTYSTIKAKSISKGGGISSYRGLVRVNKNAKNTKCSVNCDALLIDDKSVSNTFPFMKIDSNKVDIAHEANPVLQGWINYYGKYHKSALCPVFRHFNMSLRLWSMRKFKRFRGRKTKAAVFLEGLSGKQPALFAHWKAGLSGGFP